MKPSSLVDVSMQVVGEGQGAGGGGVAAGGELHAPANWHLNPVKFPGQAHKKDPAVLVHVPPLRHGAGDEGQGPLLI